MRQPEISSDLYTLFSWIQRDNQLW